MSKEQIVYLNEREFAHLAAYDQELANLVQQKQGAMKAFCVAHDVELKPGMVIGVRGAQLVIGGVDADTAGN